MNLRHEFYKLKYGEDGARARITEEARRDAITEAEIKQKNREEWEREFKNMPMNQPTPAAKVEAATVTIPNNVAAHYEKLSALFDPVTVEALEKTFPADGNWKKWAERAARNGLRDAAKEGRGRFNPHKAAVWFVNQGIKEWNLARCYRVLANNLPARSRDDKHLLTGDID